MDYDGGYHLVFSNPELMEELVRGFVDEPWMDQVDFSSIERVNAKFHTQWLSRRESDIIYKVKLVDGREIYLYLLLEFQTQVDTWMPVRMTTYVSLLQQQLIREGKLINGLLPPVFPIVLYNGQRPWSKPVSSRDLVALPEDSTLWKYQPDLHYFLIEENQYQDLHSDNAVNILFLLENSATPEQAKRAVHALARIAHHYRQPIITAITQFITFVIERKIGVKLNPKQTLQEIEAMVTTTFKEWEEEKVKEGRIEGRTEGRKEGETFILLSQIEKRFGVVPEWVMVKVQNADTAILEKWSLRLLDVSSIEEVFD